MRQLWSEAIARTRPAEVELRHTLRAAEALTLRGGKRLRAALVALGYLASRPRGGPEPTIGLGVAVELVQAYFLIHDDWMDRDPVRRGGPSVHAALEQVLGDAHLAACGAVLAGDYCQALALQELAKAPVAPRRRAEVLGAFAQMQADAVIGQKLDVLSSTAAPEEVYRLKTASYTVLGPLWLGAVQGGAPAEDRVAWERFARPLGVAFQLRDDLLGVLGEESVTGKPWGSDLRSGKRTALVQLVDKLGSGAERAAVRRVLGRSDASDAQVRRAVSALQSSGVCRRVEQRARRLAAEAERAVAELPLRRAAAATLLSGAARALTRRSA